MPLSYEGAIIMRPIYATHDDDEGHRRLRQSKSRSTSHRKKLVVEYCQSSGSESSARSGSDTDDSPHSASRSPSLLARRKHRSSSTRRHRDNLASSSHSHAHSHSHSVNSLRTSLLESKLRYRELKGNLRRSRVKQAALERELSSLRDARTREREQKHRADMELLAGVTLHGSASSSAQTASLAQTAAAQDALFQEKDALMAKREQTAKVELERENLKVIRTQNELLQLQARYTQTKRTLANMERQSEAARVEKELKKEEREDEEKYPLPAKPVEKPRTTGERNEAFVTTHTTSATATIEHPAPSASSSSSSSSRSRSKSRNSHKHQQPVIQVITNSNEQSQANGTSRRDVTVEVEQIHSTQEERKSNPTSKQHSQAPSRRESVRSLVGQRNEEAKELQQSLVNVKIEPASLGSAASASSTAPQQPLPTSTSSSSLAFDSTSQEHVQDILRRLERSERNLDTLGEAVLKKSPSREPTHRRDRRGENGSPSRKSSTRDGLGLGVQVTRSTDAQGGRAVHLHLSPSPIRGGRHRERDYSGSDRSRSRSRSRSNSSDSDGGSSSRESSPTRIIIRATAHADPSNQINVPLKVNKGESKENESSSDSKPPAKKILKKRPTPSIPTIKKPPPVLPGANKAFMTQTSNSLKRQREMIERMEGRKKTFVRPKVQVSAPSPIRKPTKPVVVSKKKKRSASAAPPVVREQPITLRLEVEAEPGRRRARSISPPKGPTRAELELRQRLELQATAEQQERDDQLKEHQAYTVALEARQKALDARRARREALRAQLVHHVSQVHSPGTSSLGSLSPPFSPADTSTIGSVTPRTPLLPRTPPSPVAPSVGLYGSGSLASDPFPSTSPLPYSSPSSTAHLLALHARQEHDREVREAQREERHREKKRLLTEYREKLEQHYQRARIREEKKRKKQEAKKLAIQQQEERARTQELERLRAAEFTRQASEQAKLAEDAREWRRRCEEQELQRKREKEKERMRRRREKELAAANAQGASICITSTPSRNGSHSARQARIVIDTTDQDLARKRARELASQEALEEERERERDRERQIQLQRELRAELDHIESLKRRQREQEQSSSAAALLAEGAELLRHERRRAAARRKRQEQQDLADEQRSRREQKDSARHPRDSSPSSLSARERAHKDRLASLDRDLDSAHSKAHFASEADKVSRHRDLLGGLVSNGPGGGQGLRPYGQALSSWNAYSYPTSSGLWPTVAAYNGVGMSGLSGSSSATATGPYGPMPIVGGGQVYPFYTPPGDYASQIASGTAAAPVASSNPHHSYIVDATTLGPVKPGDLIYDPLKQHYVQVEEEVHVLEPFGAPASLPQRMPVPAPLTANAATTSTHPVSSVASLLDRLHASVAQVQPQLWQA